MGKRNHAPWVKGQSGNPKGGSKKRTERAKLTRMTHEQIADIGTALLSGNIDELQAVIKNPKASALQSWTAALVIQSMKKGDSGIYRAILDRIAGKIPEVIQHKEMIPEKVEDIKEEIEKTRQMLERLKKGR